MTNEEYLSLIQELREVYGKEMVERVESQPYYECDSSFHGFLDKYKQLSEMIPRHFTVIDLGCYDTFEDLEPIANFSFHYCPMCGEKLGGDS